MKKKIYLVLVVLLFSAASCSFAFSDTKVLKKLKSISECKKGIALCKKAGNNSGISDLLRYMDNDWHSVDIQIQRINNISHVKKAFNIIQACSRSWNRFLQKASYVFNKKVEDRIKYLNAQGLM